MKKKTNTLVSDVDNKEQEVSDVDSEHESPNISPIQSASVLELDTHSSDEESDDEHDTAKVLFSSPEPKKKSISKQIKSSQNQDEKFSSYFDDSSSEEDENEAEYDITTSFQDFPKTSAAYKNAFYSHALGIQIFRAPLVRKFYYEEKTKYLKHEDEVLDDATIRNWLREHIEQTLLEECFYLPGQNSKHILN